MLHPAFAEEIKDILCSIDLFPKFVPSMS